MNTLNNADRTSNDADPDAEPAGCGAWAPALIAVGSLMLMLFFITCAGGTYYLFQQRGDLALRTIEGTLIPLLQQSRLEPDDKQATIEELEGFIIRGRSGELENDQIAGVMQRLYRSPVVSWGDLQFIDLIIAQRESFADEEKASSRQAISRLQRGAELGKVTQIEMPDLFAPISSAADHASGYTLDDEFSDEALREFIARVRLVAKRAEVPEKQYDIKLLSIIKRQIEAGVESGMK